MDSPAIHSMREGFKYFTEWRDEISSYDTGEY